MVFRLSFFGTFLTDAVLFLMQLLAFQMIFSQVDSIGGWNQGQMLIFIGTFSMINSLNMLISLFGIIEIPRKIHDGTLDHYLTKPVNALLRLSFEHVDPASLLLVIFSGVIIVYGVNVAGVTITVSLMLLYIALVLIMALLWYDMAVILRSLSFFFIVASDIDPIERLEGQLLSLNFKIPGVIYSGFFRMLFYFVLPYGIMATVPTQALTGTLTLRGLMHAVAMVIIFTAFTLWFWRCGLRHYKSASS